MSDKRPRPGEILTLAEGLLYRESGALVTLRNYDKQIRDAYRDASERWQQRCADSGRRITWLPDGRYKFDGEELKAVAND